MKTVALPIEGMSCASCVSAVERRLQRETGVHRVNVNLATQIATIEYDEATLNPSALVIAVRDAGYELSLIHI